LTVSLLVSWREGVTASADGEGTLVVHGPNARISLRKLPAIAFEVLRRLDSPGFDLDRLPAFIDNGDSTGLAECHYHLERLTRRGLLSYSVRCGNACLATMIPVSPAFVSGPAHVVVGQRYVLSRFACVRRQGTSAVLESPLAHARIVLHDCRTAALVGALAASATAEEAAERVGGLDVDAVTRLLSLFLRAGLLNEADNEEHSPALESWEFHDLLFHARTRLGRFDAGYGGTYRFANRVAPPPALKPVTTGPAFDLHRPDLDQLKRDDRPLAWVQAQRRSIRDFDSERPITDRQLGEFLFRVARVTDHREEEVATPVGPVRQQFAARPYPAGGGLYELELYAAIQRCNHLAGGLYHYDPAGHRLIQLRGRTPEVDALVSDAAASAATPSDSLQVLLIVAARFQRLAWKYESIAYALILKHVGVLYQTMYLTATAMGLAPCAIGGGNADLFARAAGTDYYLESSVGEFLLGNPRP
jgi:oxazoline/thiazoline dehydrogenase